MWCPEKSLWGSGASTRQLPFETETFDISAGQNAALHHHARDFHSAMARDVASLYETGLALDDSGIRIPGRWVGRAGPSSR